MFLLFPNIHLPFLIFHNNLHSNMFLLFLNLIDCFVCLDWIYIPICFYYFQGIPLEVRAAAEFTFQYVSIISYDSDIVSLTEVYLHSNMFLLFQISGSPWTSHLWIYIPICFYYFYSSTEQKILLIKFTFQYVSIISMERRTMLLKN